MKKKNKELIAKLNYQAHMLNQENQMLRGELRSLSDALVTVVVADLANCDMSVPEVKNVKFDPPYTTVCFGDNTKSVAKCSASDTFSKETGMFVALSKKVYGDKIYSYIDKYCK